jgi:peptidoglycan/LPS O-acetylase OafA/YrhL
MARYQTSIDGLRALSVLSVLAFHLDHAYLPGGFTGVDVFFTISGYLIGQILLREVGQGTFSFGGFYQRRIARLVPTFAVVSLGTLAAALVIYSDQDAANVGSRLVSATLGIANLKEMQIGNYFMASPDASPLLHCWSLAVEEQFYLVFPLLLIVMRSWPQRTRMAVLFALTLLSLASAVYLTQARPMWAFYLLPTRAWEMLAGVLLAALGPSFPSRAPAVGWIGLALICAGFVFIDAKGFPGFQALLPVTGTVLLIHAVSSDERSMVARLLSISPAVAIGRASYVLYMVHWPVFCFVDYYAFRSSLGVRTAAQLAITAALTFIIHRAIEAPSRAALRQRERRKVAFAVLATTAALGVGLGVYIRETKFIHGRPDSEPKVVNASARGGDLVLLGDSFGAVYGTALLEVARARDLRLHAFTYPGQAPLPLPSGGGLWSKIIAPLEAIRPKTVILAMSWMTKLHDDPSRLLRGLEQLEPNSARIIALTQPPHRPPTGTREAIRRGARGPIWERPEIREARQRTDRYVRALSARGVEIVDVEAMLTNPDGSIRVFDENGRENYHDVHHLSAHGSKLVAAAIAKILDQPLPAK